MTDPSPSSPSRYAVYLLPGVIFQSVLIGGAYATGREIVEYGARFGPRGAWSIVAILLGFSLMCVVAFEFCRVARVYDYRSFVRELIGPLWPLFDALFVVMAIIVIAVVGAATGSVVEEILGWPYWLGVGLVIVLVGVINARGRRTIERFKTVGSMLLYAGYIVFAGLVLARRGDRLLEVLGLGAGAAAGGTGAAAGGAGLAGGTAAGSAVAGGAVAGGAVAGSAAAGNAAAGVAAAAAAAGAAGPGEVGLGTLLLTGILYVGYNLATLPATFFTLDTQRHRREAVTAGLVAGTMATVPFVLTWLAVLSFWPDPEVLGAPVPWLAMLRRVGGETLLTVYALVIVWTLVETSVGMIHAIVDRIAVNLKEHDLPPLTRGRVATLTVAVLLVAALLSRFGLIALVAQGYTLMAYGFLLLFALPLLTRGVVRMARSRLDTI